MRAALGFGHLPETKGFSWFNRLLSHLAAKTVYCALSCWPKWSSTEATSSLRGNCHIPPQLLTCGEQTQTTQSLVRHHHHVPLGTGQPTPHTQGCTPRCQHHGFLTVPWPLSPLSSLLSSGEKSSIFTIAQQLEEDRLLAHNQTPKAAWQCNQPVPTAACQAHPSAPSIFFPHWLH